MKIEIAEYCIRCCYCSDNMPDVFSYDPVEDEIVVSDPGSHSYEELKVIAGNCSIAAIRLKAE